MDFVFGLPPDAAGNTGVVVFVDRLSKMADLAAVPDTIDGEGTASLFLDRVFRQHGLPEAVVSDRVLDVHLRGAWHSLGHVHRGSSADRRSDGTRQPRLSRMTSAAFALKCLSVGAPCSHSLSLR
ncbi:unnamed protein product [Phytophthora fragariaefolia]|uniref:Unnamed protein product n=1 Tax=Phytophthora fragariaefolia TaxID=1490495 RepID=A0A9W6YM89_9STRA|nr:unnamed protein product [Phytophthora fragariaefolia]